MKIINFTKTSFIFSTVAFLSMPLHAQLGTQIDANTYHQLDRLPPNSNHFKNIIDLIMRKDKSMINFNSGMNNEEITSNPAKTKLQARQEQLSTKERCDLFYNQYGRDD